MTPSKLPGLIAALCLFAALGCTQVAVEAVKKIREGDKDKSEENVQTPTSEASAEAVSEPPAPALAGPAPRLQYELKADDYFGYETTIKVETSEWTETYTANSLYRVAGVFPDSALVVHTGELDVDYVGKNKASGIIPAGWNRIPPPNSIRIRRSGELVSSDRMTPLPHALGDLEMVALEQLAPDAQHNWQVTSEFRIHESRGMAFHVGGASRTATDQANYRIARVEGDTVWIDKTYQLTTGKEASNVGQVTIRGKGRVAFDKRLGRVASLKMDYTIESEENGKAETARASVTCGPMEPSKFQRLVAEKREQLRREEEALLASDREEAARDASANHLSDAAASAPSASERAEPADADPFGSATMRTWADATGKFQVEAEFVGVDDGKVKLKRADSKVIEVPLNRLSQSDQNYVLSLSGAAAAVAAAGIPRDTELAGGSGGSPFRLTGNGVLVGIRYTLGSWGGEETIGHIEPIFGGSGDRTGDRVVVARSGYVVGSVIVDADKYVNALQLVFHRQLPGGRLDPADSYRSEWIGKRTSRATRTLGNGMPVVGLHGRRGLILDAIGLIVQM